MGNASLLPEKAISFESGMKYFRHGMNLHLSLFKRWGNNLIDWTRSANETVWYARNITHLNTSGFEVGGEFHPQAYLDRKFIITSIAISYGFMTQSKSSGDYLSKYLLDYLKHKLDLRVTHPLTKNLTACWMLTWQDRNGTFTQWEGSQYGSEMSYSPILLIDSRINWSIRSFDLYLEANNLLNKTYFDYGNVRQPGIWTKVGVVFRLNFIKAVI
ncbi:MAG: TonB-dependent receptor [Marinilabiliales bacterium]|nr:TonB-dependent receptor [Marinilabiliales bacterium]